MTTNPALLTWALYSCWRYHGTVIGSMEQLHGWLKQHLFDKNIEYGAFKPAGEFSSSQLRRLVRWLVKPSRKRLRKFLSAAAELAPDKSDDLLSHILCSEVESELLLNADLAKLPAVENWLPGSADLEYDATLASRIWRLTTDLHEMRKRYTHTLQNEKMRAMQQLAYGASHEINNPLANIAARAQSLVVGEVSVDRKQKLSIIYTQAMRAHEMISDMMLFANPPELDPEPAAPSELIRLVVNELQPVLTRSEIKVVIRQYPDVPTFEIDLTQFAVAFKALLQNSIDAIGTSGEIRVQIWRRSPKSLAIAVSDDGPGVDHDVAGQIFNPFFSGREAGRGLGFGLSKVWRIVNLHGGYIELDEDKTDGARFVMTFPIAQAESADRSCSRIDNVRAA